MLDQTMDCLDEHVGHSYPGSSGGAEAAFLILFKDNLTGDIQNLVVSTWRFFTYYFILILSVIIFNITKGEITKKINGPGDGILVYYCFYFLVFVF